MNKVLIIDDDAAICELVKINLELAGYCCTFATEPQKGLAKARQEAPDLIILDVMMPELDGFSLAFKLRQLEVTKDVPIIMLTALGELPDKLKGFSSGADDYLTKPFEPEELKARVLAVLNRSKLAPQSLRVKEVLSVGDMTLIPESYNVRVRNKTAKLTPIEFEILMFLMQNHGNMVASKSILKEVWGYQETEDADIIRVHIRHLRSKIDKIAPLGIKYIETIYGGGYRLVPQGVETAKRG
ncbi:two-component system, OmpR family, response regulator RpaA [Candidatus Gastranaerophilus sp. (ex Termes propinquus)]|nr:two-component system, OmpR family, response regulator RpaA [Candidatus Gastranaerophilus sp. (ex Termes propinquus)]